MKEIKENRRLHSIYRYLPDRLVRELSRLSALSGYTLSEIRLRGGALSQVVSERGTLPLYTRLREEEVAAVLRAACHGSLYAYRDKLSSGYIPLEYGVRVGVVGEARYEEGEVVGIDGVRSLVFRIPTGECDFAEELYREWLAADMRSMLICAPPAGGKTTALRALAGLIGSGRDARRVVVVDERCELDPLDYTGATVDILRGYRRGLGVEVAVRTASPEVLMVDEIASEGDADALRLAIGVGIPVIATAHGEDARDAARRGYIRSLIEDGCFDTAVSIRRERGGFSLSSLSLLKC